MIGITEVRNFLGTPISSDSIAEANKEPSKNSGVREHSYKHFNFTVNDRVFSPSRTSEILHNMLFNSDLKDKKVIIMGTGCGVEGVLCAYRNASEFYAVDIHRDSVKCATDNYKRNVPQNNETVAHFLTSNLFEGIPSGTKADVICFDPPAVKVRFSDDPNVIRCSCTGASVLNDFFTQIIEKDLLNEDGSISIVISNTSDQDQILSSAYAKGYFVKGIHEHTWQPPYEKVKTLRLDFGFNTTIPFANEF